MYVDIEYAGVHVTANIDNKVIIIAGDSGIGKTFFIKVLNTYFLINGDLRAKIFNVDDLYGVSLDKFRLFIEDFDVLLLDNADIYLTQEMYDCLVSSGKYCIIILHKTYMFNFHDSVFRNVIYEDGVMTLNGGGSK